MFIVTSAQLSFNIVKGDTTAQVDQLPEKIQPHNCNTIAYYSSQIYLWDIKAIITIYFTDVNSIICCSHDLHLMEILYWSNVYFTVLPLPIFDVYKITIYFTGVTVMLTW